MTLHYSEDNRAFVMYDEDGELYERLDPRGCSDKPAEHNMEVRRAAKRVIDPALAERLKAYSEYLHAEQNNGHPATGSRNSPILG